MRCPLRAAARSGFDSPADYVSVIIAVLPPTAGEPRLRWACCQARLAGNAA